MLNERGKRKLIMNVNSVGIQQYQGLMSTSNISRNPNFGSNTKAASGPVHVVYQAGMWAMWAMTDASKIEQNPLVYKLAVDLAEVTAVGIINVTKKVTLYGFSKIFRTSVKELDNFPKFSLSKKDQFTNTIVWASETLIDCAEKISKSLKKNKTK